MADQWRNTGAALTRLLARATPDSIQAEDVAIVRVELDTLRQRLAEVEAQLAECFRLGGADNDGNGESWQAQRAVESVRNLRKDYDDACEEMYGEGGLNKRADAAEAKLALAEADNARLNRLLHASADSSHKCKRCGLPYTPLDGASEDCPDCGYDGIPAIDGSGEGHAD